MASGRDSPAAREAAVTAKGKPEKPTWPTIEAVHCRG
jgi:hypothetical protein